jgi:hypothetical protein
LECLSVAVFGCVVDILGMSLFTFDDIWVQEHLTSCEAAMLLCLVKSGCERVPLERLACVYATSRSLACLTDQDPKNVRNYVWHLKQKVRPLGFTITNRHSWGYRLERAVSDG